MCCGHDALDASVEDGLVACGVFASSIVSENRPGRRVVRRVVKKCPWARVYAYPVR